MPIISTPTISSPAQPQLAPVPTEEPAILSLTELAEAMHNLWQRSSDGLNSHQRLQLKRLLDDYVDIFAARDEDCSQTGLVQHAIETCDAQPI